MSRARKAPATREDVLARACAGFLDCALPEGAMFTHIPAGGARNVIVGSKLKAEGVRKGAPDYLIVAPGVGVIFAELKAEDGRLSPEQKRWGEAIHATPGVFYGVIYGAEDLERLLVRAGVKLRASLLALRTDVMRR